MSGGGGGWRRHLVASDTVVVVAGLPEHVPQAAPGGRVAVLYPQRLLVAPLGLLPAQLPLGPPQVPQVVVNIHLQDRKLSSMSINFPLC